MKIIYLDVLYGFNGRKYTARCCSLYHITLLYSADAYTASERICHYGTRIYEYAVCKKEKRVEEYFNIPIFIPRILILKLLLNLFMFAQKILLLLYNSFNRTYYYDYGADEYNSISYCLCLSPGSLQPSRRATEKARD